MGKFTRFLRSERLARTLYAYNLFGLMATFCDYISENDYMLSYYVVHFLAVLQMVAKNWKDARRLRSIFIINTAILLVTLLLKALMDIMWHFNIIVISCVIINFVHFQFYHKWTDVFVEMISGSE
ncbi:hypothetical protein TNCT_674201 [Trichonephila clavata]|uniref:Uncharacterized protein n=1 Tax=Trichonephila clavata TaxID=2740835 RepID=A0A8X6HKF6_TRICU|nr:hypothetical protein TNCT_674201 [Trichonephila clavata]